MRSVSASVLTIGSESTTASTSGCCFRPWELQTRLRSGSRLQNVLFVSTRALESGYKTGGIPSRRTLCAHSGSCRAVVCCFRCQAGQITALFSCFYSTQTSFESEDEIEPSIMNHVDQGSQAKV